MSDEANYWIALIFIVIGVLLGIVASYIFAIMSEGEFIRIMKIITIIILILIGSIITATGIVMILTPASRKE